MANLKEQEKLEGVGKEITPLEQPEQADDKLIIGLEEGEVK